MFKFKVSVLSTLMALSLAGCNDKNSTDDNIENSSIGVQSFYFTNDNITDQIPPLLLGVLPLETNNTRQLLVKIWYPATATPDEKSRFHYGYHTPEYLYPIEPGNQEDLEFLQSHEVQSQSYQNAKPENNKFPVIVYSHGLGGHIEDNEPYFESLVKQGYVVVSIGHTYEAGFVNFSPGKYAVLDEVYAEHANITILPEYEINPSMLSTDEDIMILGAISAGAPLPDEPLRRYFYSEGNIKTGERAHLDLWVEDTNFVVSQLRKVNNGIIESNLKGMFDLTRIGASGHSYGGATARRFCNQEAKCLASVHLDGDIYELYDEKIINPHMSLSADVEGWVAAKIRNDEEFSAAYNAATDEDIAEIKEKITIQFSAYKNAHIHSAASDLILFSPKTISHSDFHTSWINHHDFGLGKAAWHSIIESSSTAFFNSYLKDNTGKSDQPNLALCEILLDENVTSYYDTLCN